MPNVQSCIIIPQCRKQKVWPILRGFDAYPSFMDDVLEVTSTALPDGSAQSNWRVLLNGSELTWTERDWFEDETRIVFSQIDGDLEIWEGAWSIEQVGADVRLSLEVMFDLGIPSLAEVLNPIGARAIHQNTQQMLTAIRDLVAAKADT